MHLHCMPLSDPDNLLFTQLAKKQHVNQPTYLTKENPQSSTESYFQFVNLYISNVCFNSKHNRNIYIYICCLSVFVRYTLTKGTSKPKLKALSLLCYTFINPFTLLLSYFIKTTHSMLRSIYKFRSVNCSSIRTATTRNNRISTTPQCFFCFFFTIKCKYPFNSIRIRIPRHPYQV